MLSKVVFRIELQKYKGYPNNVLLPVCSLATKGGGDPSHYCWQWMLNVCLTQLC